MSPVDTNRRQWRVPRKVMGAKFAAAGVFLVAALWFSDDPARLLVAAVAAVVLAGYGARDLKFPVRLSVGADGVAVSRGYLVRREIAWGEIERIRVDRRKRLGTATELLEIDIDSTLFLFSRYDLDAAPEEVRDELLRWRDDSRHRDSAPKRT
ncbi:hypothetical protein GCM10023223_30780 [Stackebrandtia albiflava]